MLFLNNFITAIPASMEFFSRIVKEKSDKYKVTYLYIEILNFIYIHKFTTNRYPKLPIKLG